MSAVLDQLPDPGPNPARVLLVEDDVDLGSALSEYFELCGLKVDWACSGIEFYAHLQQEVGYEVAVIDIGLPDQSGLVLSEYVRRNTLSSVIVLTANDNTDLITDAYNLGVDLFIGKPVDNRVLLSAIHSMAERSRQRMASGEGRPAVPVQSQRSAAATLALSRKQQNLPWKLDPWKRRLIAPNGKVVNLGARELKIFKLLVSHPERFASRTDQVHAVYGREDESSHRSLDTLMSRLRHKIVEETGLESPILTEYGIGHSFTEPLERAL